MSTFNLPNTNPPIPVSLPDDLTKDQLLKFPAFKNWLAAIQKSLRLQDQSTHPFYETPYKLRSITVQACDHFHQHNRVGFIKLQAEVTNDKGEWLPGAVFLRGGSVAMLLVLQVHDASDSNEEYVILTVQPRVAAGSLGFIELPAGMIDDSGSFAGKAAQEIKEETGLEIEESELIDMTELTLQARTTEDESDESHLQRAFYPSPGGCDEFIPSFLARKRMSRKEVEELKGKLTGLREDGEKITLKICRLNDLWKVAARDGKTLAALALYEALKRENKL